MIRGGSYNNNETNLRSSNRNDNNPSNENNNVGFRPVEAHEKKERARIAVAIRRLRQCPLRDYLFVRRLRECEAANKKAPPAVSSESERRGRGYFFLFVVIALAGHFVDIREEL